MSRSSRKQADSTTPAIAAASSSRLSNRVLLWSSVVIWLLLIFSYAGDGWASVLYRLLTDGVILLAWLLCAAGLGSVVLRVLPLSTDEDQSPILLQFITATAIGIGIISLCILALGLAGLLIFTTSTILMLAGGACGIALLAHSSAKTERMHAQSTFRNWLNEPAGASILLLAAMPFLGLAIVAALLPPGILWLPLDPHPYDVVEYHLQIPREWYEIGRIVPLHHNAFSFFPFNVELQYLLAMNLRGGPWAGMYLAQFMHLAMIVLTVGAVHGFARQLSRSKAVASIATIAVATVPWMAQLGSVAYNEGGLLLFGTLATGWAFRAAINPSKQLGRFPIAGLMAGFACGSKLTAVPEVLLAVGAAATLGVMLTHRRSSVAFSSGEKNPGTVPMKLRFAGVAMFFVAGVVAFSPWLIRNQLWARNALFPEAAGVLGPGHFTPAQVDRWKHAHSPRPDQQTLAARITAWRTGVWQSWQYGYVLFPVALLAAGTRLFRNMRFAGLLLILTFAVLSIVWLGFTHLQGRFFIFAVPLAGLMLGCAAWGRTGLWVSGALVLVAGGFGFAHLHSELAQRLFDRQMTALLGFENLPEFMTPAALKDVPQGAPVVLVGDARAFVYPGPMNRLFYRTVFDVDAKPDESVIDAWRQGAPDDAWLLVDPNELRRFRSTYTGIPDLPAEYANQTEPFLIPPK